MVKFGGNEFKNCAVPLAFKGHYFILGPGETPKISVVSIQEKRPVFEILNNEPIENPYTTVEKNHLGIITVSDKLTGKFMYKFRPESETSIIFGTLEDGGKTIKFSDKRIQIGGITLENNTFETQVGIIIEENGNIGLGARFPQELLDLFQTK